jgi:hypothetical protein
MKYGEEKENRGMKQRQRQNMPAGNKNGRKAIERLYTFTIECSIQPMQTDTDTKTRGPTGMSDINLHPDGSFRDLIDFSATYTCTNELEEDFEYKCNSDDILP